MDVLIRTKGCAQRKVRNVTIAKKPNHFAAVCRGKQKETQSLKPPARRAKTYKNNARRNVKTLDTESSSSSDEDYLHSLTKSKQDNIVNVTVGGAKFKTTTDSGATINVIDHGTFSKMQNITLTRTKTKAFAYDTTSPVEFVGKFDAVIETKKKGLLSLHSMLQKRKTVEIYFR